MTDTLQGLRPQVLAPLPLGQIQPTGWLRAQLRIQADGLSGHLDEFWPDIANSRWIGGHAEGWERGPYWLDGGVPVAYLPISVHWLYERTHEAWLLDLVSKLHDQGFDWRAHFARFAYREKTRREECDLRSHVVNNAMAIKQPGVWLRQSHDPADQAAV